ncbi:hypothetical protein SAMN05444679_1163 [Variovorax sp. CF079]|uniref:hypothetical protein n=1 Tax=Variovorax sp. CF079 TaxID=1882774 RepID=UPI000885BCFD|nr:hypothetical protein [Variovorax sp. CF079]SDE00037.1 hypothetical protein SAMN05444679_1163 [Variovorax sp. CF079]
MTAASVSFGEPPVTSSGVAFGNLIDLARLQSGTASAEICEACSTINMGSARYCKCCSHKLPAFYASRDAGKKVPLPKESRIVLRRAWALDFAAFWLVINSLVIVTKFIPIP